MRFADDDEDEEITEQPPLPRDREHDCTDPLGVVLLIAALGGLAYIGEYARQHRVVRRLFHGFDFEGKLCGVDAPGSFVFWCANETLEAWPDYPICVDSCPDGSGMAECVDPELQAATGVWRTKVRTYPTIQWWQFCLPKNRTKATALWKAAVGDTRLGFNLAFRAWSAIKGGSVTFAALLANAVGFGYLLLLQHYAEPLVRICMLILIVLPLFEGLVFLGEALGYLGEVSREKQQEDLVFGCAFFACSLAMVVIVCCKTGMDTAIHCIQAACECVFQDLSLILEPFISLGMKVAVMFYGLVGFVHLVSCAEIRSIDQRGLRRSIELGTELPIYITFHVFITAWLLELSLALSQYSIAWTTQDWYFTPSGARHVSCKNAGRGYVSAIRFHLGTLVFGSLLIFTMRPFRWLSGAITRVGQSCGSCFGASVAETFACLRTLHEQFFQRWDRAAFMDVALYSDRFCTSAKRAASIIGDEFPAVSTLRGVQAIFLLAGVGMTTVVPAFLVWVWSKWSGEDAFSPNTSKHKDALIAAGAIGFSVGFSFMTLFDIAVDAMLHCFSIHRLRHRLRAEYSRKSLKRELHGLNTINDVPLGGLYGPSQLSHLIENQNYKHH